MKEKLTKNGQLAVHETQRLIIKGILTSRIETRTKDKETYSYGFFQIEGQSQDIPVIFKGGGKHGILIGSQVELTGT